PHHVAHLDGGPRRRGGGEVGAPRGRCARGPRRRAERLRELRHPRRGPLRRDGVTPPGLAVVHEADRSRYVLRLDGRVVGVADYRDRGDALVFHHTEIDPARRGHGLGAILVRGALDDVRARGRVIVPTCWYVAEF